MTKIVSSTNDKIKSINSQEFIESLFHLFRETEISIKNINSHEQVNVWKTFFSRYFPFDDDYIIKYFGEIDWRNFIHNSQAKISPELKVLLRNKIEYDGINLIKFKNSQFHPFEKLEEFAEFFESEEWQDTFFSPKEIYRVKKVLVKQFDAEYYTSISSSNPMLRLLSSIENFDWSSEFIRKNRDGLCWRFLSINESLPFLEKGFLQAFTPYWDWKLLSSNAALPITVKLLEIYENQFDWYELSANKGKFWNEDLILRFATKWNWCRLSRNNSIHWTLEIVEKVEDLIDWKGLSGNSRLAFSHEFLDKYKDKLFWPGFDEIEVDGEDKYGRHKADTEIVGVGISMNDGFIWNEEYLSRYEKYLDWKSIEESNPFITWDLGLIEQFKQRLSWSHFFLQYPKEEKFERGWDKLFNSYNASVKIKSLSKLKFSNELVSQFLKVFHIPTLFENENIDWDLTLLNKACSTLLKNLIYPYNIEPFVKDYIPTENDTSQKVNSEEINTDFSRVDVKHPAVAGSLYAIAHNRKIYKQFLGSYLKREIIDRI